MSYDLQLICKKANFKNELVNNKLIGTDTLPKCIVHDMERACNDI